MATKGETSLIPGEKPQFSTFPELCIQTLNIWARQLREAYQLSPRLMELAPVADLSRYPQDNEEYVETIRKTVHEKDGKREEFLSELDSILMAATHIVRTLRGNDPKETDPTGVFSDKGEMAARLKKYEDLLSSGIAGDDITLAINAYRYLSAESYSEALRHMGGDPKAFLNRMENRLSAVLNIRIVADEGPKVLEGVARAYVRLVEDHVEARKYAESRRDMGGVFSSSGDVPIDIERNIREEAEMRLPKPHLVYTTAEYVGANNHVLRNGGIKNSRCVPIYYGPPGIGKTALIEMIASYIGIPMMAFSMGQTITEELTGLPSTDEKTDSIKKLMMSAMSQASTSSAILLFDEMGTAMNETQAALLRALQKGEVADITLHPLALFLGATNRSIDGLNRNLAPALRGRMASFSLMPPDDDPNYEAAKEIIFNSWCSWCEKNYSGQGQLSEAMGLVLSFLESGDGKGYFLQTPENLDEDSTYGYPSPRSWSAAIHSLSDASMSRELTPGLVETLASEYVGPEAAAALGNFSKSYGMVPTINELFEKMAYGPAEEGKTKKSKSKQRTMPWFPYRAAVLTLDSTPILDAQAETIEYHLNNETVKKMLYGFTTPEGRVIPPSLDKVFEDYDAIVQKYGDITQKPFDDPDVQAAIEDLRLEIQDKAVRLYAYRNGATIRDDRSKKPPMGDVAFQSIMARRIENGLASYVNNCYATNQPLRERVLSQYLQLIISFPFPETRSSMLYSMVSRLCWKKLGDMNLANDLEKKFMEIISQNGYIPQKYDKEGKVVKMKVSEAKRSDSVARVMTMLGALKVMSSKYASVFHIHGGDLQVNEPGGQDMGDMEEITPGM